MDPLREIAAERRIANRRQRAGHRRKLQEPPNCSLGDIACISFYPTKI